MTEGQTSTHWITPEESGSGRPKESGSGRHWTLVLLALAGGIPAAFLAWKTLGLYVGAGSDCEIFEAGDRFGFTLFILPAMAIGFWIVYSVVLVVLSRWSIPVGVILGVCAVLLIAYTFAAGTGDMIRSHPYFDPEYCPINGPDWWPAWIPF